DLQYEIRELANCSPPSILEFPNVLRRKSAGWTVVVFLFTLYLFIVLAIVCDDYLVPAMERLSFYMRLTYDVAGATLLASATSAPELFVNVMGTFVTKGDIGIGTIVGSSVFNILVIVAVCGIFTPPSKLDWWPVSRDSIWFVVAIICLTSTLWDSRVHWYESTALVVTYLVYLFSLVMDCNIQRCIRNKDKQFQRIDEDPLLREDEPLKSFREQLRGERPEPEDQATAETTAEAKPVPGRKCCKFGAWVWWAVKFPAGLALAVTIPSVRSRAYLITMVMAVIWISALSYLITWCLTIVGYNLGIPDSIMGLTVLAAGTSVPEVASSYLVSKKGYGSMAICNALASNTIDILVCLGMPWLIRNITHQTWVTIDSTAITITTAMLLLTVFLLFSVLACSRFVMGKALGWICLVTYVVYLSLACFLEIFLNKTVSCNIED
ncbi:hypothetical protein KR018_002804, partial [Drosophila ironensis]